MQVKGVNRVIRNATLLMMKTIVFYTRGKNFVLFFKEIKQLRAVYPYAQVLALSAFLSKDGQKSVAQQLLITQYESIISNPSKDTSLVVKGRPAVGKQNLFEKSLWLSVWVCVYELQRKQQDYPLTLIYSCGTLIGWDMVLSWLREFSDTACMVVMDNLRVPMFHSVFEKGNEVFNASKTHKVS